MISVSETGSVMVNEANVVITDIAASNGVIHVLDAVLVPPSFSSISSETTATAADAETITTVGATTEVTTCSCSPVSYTFTLTLTQNCTDNTIQDNSGIFATDCFLGSLVATSSSSTTARSFEERAFTSEEFATFQRTIAADTAVEIISVSFIEFDTSGEFIVLSQDDTYLTTSLGQGDTVTFNSISADLDPSVPASEQTELIPGGVMVTIKAKYTDEETGEDLLVINRVAWNYILECDVVTLEVGDYLAWATAVSFPMFVLALLPCPSTLREQLKHAVGSHQTVRFN